MEDKGSWHGLDRYLKQATMSMSMEGGEDKKDDCLVLFFFFGIIKKKKVFSVGSSTPCHVMAMSNTTCTTQALLDYHLNHSFLGVGTKTHTIKPNPYGDCPVQWRLQEFS